jgi:FecR-like protein
MSQLYQLKSSFSCAMAAAIVAIAFWLGDPTPLFAQAGGCQLIPDDHNPSEKILRCGDGLTIRSAEKTRYHLVDEHGQALPSGTAPKALPSGAQLESGALMLEFKPTDNRRNFQILTPHAIAAVRGTTWAVEVEPDRTSTLVISGFVEVMRPNAKTGTRLRAGQGADVSAEPGPIMAKRWATPRVHALLARFGQ